MPAATTKPTTCTFWLQNRCRNTAETCPFAHHPVSASTAHLPTPSPSPHLKPLPPPPSTKPASKETPCRFWAQGRCRNEQNCPYAHSEPGRRPDAEKRRGEVMPGNAVHPSHAATGHAQPNNAGQRSPPTQPRNPQPPDPQAWYLQSRQPQPQHPRPTREGKERSPHVTVTASNHTPSHTRSTTSPPSSAPSAATTSPSPSTRSSATPSPPPPHRPTAPPKPQATFPGIIAIEPSTRYVAGSYSHYGAPVGGAMPMEGVEYAVPWRGPMEGVERAVPRGRRRRWRGGSLRCRGGGGGGGEG